MRKRLNLIIKLIIALAFVIGVGYQLLHERDLGLIWENFITLWTWDNAWLVVLALALMPVCWLFESAKWRLLMGPVLQMKLPEALRAVLGGISISLFTPNRIGEYGGRILFVPSRYNWWAVIATLVGSFAQNLVNVAIGLLGVMAFLLFMPEVPYAFRTGLGVLVILSLCVAIVLYFYMPSIGSYASRIKVPKWLRKPWRALELLRYVHTPHLSGALAYSFLKYVVFCSQFVLLLTYFGVSIPPVWLIAGLAVMYLMQTSIPLPPFVDVMVRSELVILLWAGFAVNELSVFAASFFIWIINLLIPAFFGLIAISTVNVLHSLGYETNVSQPDHNGTVSRLPDRVIESSSGRRDP
jgi:hypothetical protein